MAVSRFQKFIEKRWYGEPGILNLFRPLEVLFTATARRNRKAALKKQKPLPVPVLVVGNITVGGTGKTPTIISLLKFFLRQGFKPGVISRGYGRQSRAPLFVSDKSLIADVGDEASLIFQETGCPVALHNKRYKAARHLLKRYPEVDFLVADDGLQHYALERDLELVLIDGKRLFGNGHQLPLGPLREPVSRLRSADWLLVNKRHHADDSLLSQVMQDLSWQSCELKPAFFQSLETEERVEIPRFLERHQNMPACAITAIAYPDDFYASLKALGLKTDNESFPDHYQWDCSDLTRYSAKVLLCTSKDAVKLQQLLKQHPQLDSTHWFSLQTEMSIPETLKVEICARLQKCMQLKKQNIPNR